MNYQEAVKKVKASKPEEAYLLITMNYSRFVMSYKDGLQLMAALQNAEQTDDWGQINRLKPLEREKVTATPLSAEEYRRIKIAQLLDLSYAEVLEIERQQHTNQPEKETA